MSANLGQRIVIVGATGSGKTTLAQQIAARLNLKHVELDALHWDAGWTEAPTDIFIERLQKALAADAWITDGNYSKARHVVWARADTLIWLDYPLSLSLWRLMKRSLWRSFSGVELWNGNRETFRAQFLSRDSLFVWAWRFHKKRRPEYPNLFKQPEYAHLHVIRLYSPKETEKWLESIVSPYCCHACGWDITEDQWHPPTYDICACCGIQFTAEDKYVSFVRSYREKWIEEGTQWFDPKHKPKNWSLEEQLKQIPKEFL